MQKKHDILFLLKKVAQGLILSLSAIAFLLISKEDLYVKILLYETLPYLNIEKDVTMLFKFNQTKEVIINEKQFETFVKNTNEPVLEIVEAVEVLNNDIIGINNVIFQDENANIQSEQLSKEDIMTHNDIEKLKNIDYLSSKFYTAEKTLVTSEDFDVEKFINTDLKINEETKGPKILIFHTHISEMFEDSILGNINEGVFGVGEKLKEELESRFNIEVLHHDGVYDMLDGMSHINGAYERMEIDIKKILEENPTIEVVIDLHRDGIANPNRKLLTNIDGKQTAQIMFFNGLSKINENGVLKKVESLPNPNLPVNLAFSFNMQLVANTLYPSFTRKVYLKPYRFSLHMKPKSLLIEIGAQTNTKEEAFNTAKPLSEILANVILN